MSVAVDVRGFKRVCLECGTRFYDMNKRPIICPNCKTEFSGEIKVKSKRGRVAVEDDSQVKDAETQKDEEIAEEDEDDTEVVSLDDLDDADDADDEDLDGDLDDDLDPDDDLGDLSEDLADLDTDEDIDN